MTFGEVRAEVAARGYDYLPAARLTLFVERAYQRLCARYSWPFLSATVTGSAPVEVPELGHILSVVDTTIEYELPGVDKSWLLRYYPNTAQTGTPEYWYLEGNKVTVFPVTADQLSVRYQRVPPSYSENAEPLIPKAWQYLIADFAVLLCLRDNDELASSRELESILQGDLAEMAHALLHTNHQNDKTVARTGTSVDYLR